MSHQTDPNEDLAILIVERLSKIRTDAQGGYPDAFDFREIMGVPHIIVASVSHKGEPTLTVDAVLSFNEENLWCLDDDEAA